MDLTLTKNKTGGRGECFAKKKLKLKINLVVRSRNKNAIKTKTNQQEPPFHMKQGELGWACRVSLSG